MSPSKSCGIVFLSVLALLLSQVVLQSPAALAQSAAPTLDSIQPNQISNDLDTPVTILGSGFSSAVDSIQIFLGDVSLRNITWRSETELSAVIPWAMAPGTYTLRVVNPDGAEASLLSAVTVSNGIGQWTSGDLSGGPIDSIVAIPSHLGWIYAYARSSGAVYQSIDAGEHWVTRGHVPWPWGQFFTVDPIDPNHMYVNNKASADGGSTWQELKPELSPGYFTWTFPHPTDSGTIFLAMANIEGLGEQNRASGLLRSLDYGQTWQTVQDGIDPGDENVTALEFSPDNPQVIYIGTQAGNLYQSENGGDHWAKLGHMLPSIGLIRVNPDALDELWITTHFQLTPHAQVIKVHTHDLANPVALWTGHQDRNLTSLGFIDATTAYAATQWDMAWITTNGGLDWNDISPRDGKPGNCLTLDPWDPTHQTFYVADEQYGVQKTSDGGLTWQPKYVGLHAMNPDRLVIDPTNPARLYAKISSNGWPGIFLSENGGHDWAFSALNPGQRPLVSALAANPQRVFVGTHSPGLNRGPVLYYSDDQAATWTSLPIDDDANLLYPDFFYMPWALQVDPTNSSTLLMTVVIGNRDITQDQYFSDIYRSIDNGETWQRIGLESQVGHKVTNLWTMAFDPHDSQIVYANGNKELLKSSDNGQHWMVIRSMMSSPMPITIEPVAPYRVFVGREYSANGGLTWNWCNPPISVSLIAFVPGTDELYVAGNGLLRSADGGSSWKAVEGGVASIPITALALAQADSRTIVYVGTPGGTVAGGAGSPIQITSQSSSQVDAGVYRLTEVRRQLFLPLVKK